MKARFFYAAGVYSTWPKLFVLTEDGKFYCEYLNFMRKCTVEEQFDFETFKASDYVWGGYQYLTEIDLQEAGEKRLIQQGNWINRDLNQMA